MKNVLVIGGSGFLGSHLVEDLLQDSSLNVSVFDIRKSFSSPKNLKFFFTGDLTIKSDVDNALKEGEIDTVFHTATPSPFAPSDILKKVNIDGTKQLLECCSDLGVKKFILTSTSSVVYEGKDIQDANEKTPYAKKGYNFYTDSKIAQEKIVLEYDGTGGLRCVTIRPAAIFGERDMLMFPSVMAAGKRGRLRFFVGSGKNEYDFTYVKNVTHSHILAAKKLDESPEKIGGEAFFITNDEPKKFFGFLGEIAEEFGYVKPTYSVPYYVYFTIIIILEILVYLFNLFTCGIKKLSVPNDLSLEKLAYLTTHRTFSCEKAKKILGYKPKYNMKQALERTADHFREEPKKEK